MVRAQNLGERLLLARRRKGLTQHKLAEMLGIGQSSIHRMERGIVLDPHASRIVVLAKALGVTTDYLLRGVSSEDIESNLKTTSVINSFLPETIQAVKEAAEARRKNPHE